MSLGCTPQTGKILNYNSSVNNQLAHQNCSTDTRQVRQQIAPKAEKLLKREKARNTWIGRRGTCSGTHSVETRDRQQWPFVTPGQGSGTMAVPATTSNGWSLGQTQRTRPTAGDSVGTAPTRTAGRDRDEAQSLAATLRHRRPTDQSLRRTDLNLTATLRERRHGNSSTDNSGRHCQQRHSLGRQRVSSPVRQLRLTHRITSGYFVGLTLGHTVRQLR